MESEIINHYSVQVSLKCVQEALSVFYISSTTVMMDCEVFFLLNKDGRYRLGEEE